jgi:hypothetical protein
MQTKHEQAAAQWREFAADPNIAPQLRARALQAAAEQDRQAAGEPARRLCCAKPFPTHQHRPGATS